MPGNLALQHCCTVDKLAIIINISENTGIDIELVRDKVLKIQHKFLNKKELLFAKDNVEKLITIWAAKEAMYKVYGLKELDFITNLFVEDFDGAIIFGKIEKAVCRIVLHKPCFSTINLHKTFIMSKK